MFHQDSRENKTNCFPRDHTLSVIYHARKIAAIMNCLLIVFLVKRNQQDLAVFLNCFY